MTIKAFPIHTIYTSISQLYRLDFFLFEGGRGPYSHEGPRIRYSCRLVCFEKIYLQQCILYTDCVFSMENIQTGTDLRKLIGSTVALTLQAMLKAGARCLTKVRAFILALNWSAGTRPEKCVFATTGKVLLVDWCCNLNGKTLVYVSLTK